MIRIVNFSRTINVENGGAAANGSCEALIVSASDEINTAAFRLTPDEERALDDLTRVVESRLAHSILLVVPEPVAHATDPEAYCSACREFSCLLLRGKDNRTPLEEYQSEVDAPGKFPEPAPSVIEMELPEE